MRISKLLMPAVTLAGALALAGCGGGSSTPAGTAVPAADPPADPPASASVYTDITPTGARIITTQLNRPSGSLQAGGTATAGNTTITCPATAGDAGCEYRVTANGRIEQKGGATAALTNPVPQTSGGPSDSGNWLSGTALVGAVPPAGGTGALDVTINGVQRTVTPTDASTAQGTPATNEQLAGTGIKQISLRHNREGTNDEATPRNDNTDFLVWGAWIDAATAAVPSPIPERTWGGSISHGKPSRTAGASATYVGEAQGFAKTTGGWTPWGGNVNLTANFSTQNVTGVIADTAAIAADPASDTTTALAGTDIHSIHLGKAPFGSALSGKVTIRGIGAPGDAAATSARNAPSSGTWAGEFFGPKSADPTGIAGGFNVKRPASVGTGGTPSHHVGKWHGSVGSAEVTGAFGGERQP